MLRRASPERSALDTSGDDGPSSRPGDGAIAAQAGSWPLRTLELRRSRGVRESSIYRRILAQSCYDRCWADEEARADDDVGRDSAGKAEDFRAASAAQRRTDKAWRTAQ